MEKKQSVKYLSAMIIAAFIGIAIVSIGLAAPVYGAESTYDYHAIDEYENDIADDMQYMQEEAKWALRLDIKDATYSVNGTFYQFEQAPFIDPHYNRVMVPLRFVAESLGADVRWIEEIRTIEIVRDDVRLLLQVDSPLSDGMGFPMIIDGRTFVPVTYVAAVLGADVTWDEDAQAVYIEETERPGRIEVDIEEVLMEEAEDQGYQEDQNQIEAPTDEAEDIDDADDKETEGIVRPPEDDVDEDEKKEIEDVTERPAPLHPARPALAPLPEEFYAFSRSVLALTNIERIQHGLAPLIWDNDLERAARMHSMDQATNHFVSHIGSNGLTPGGRVGLESATLTRVAENIAGGTRTPEQTVAAWMRSPAHRANILNEEFVYVGIGVYILEDSRWYIYITQKFGL
ncbi:MAG: stalk domain-containing protein [Defluviitaleaceae bacterium]|nr:stalk domain-containing protein [Defluviitaleaceae bacterium]